MHKNASKLLWQLHKKTIENVTQTFHTSKTEIPTVHATGFPPKVLKWPALVNAFATSGVVTTAASGKPLPIPLAIVTISGLIPCISKPQKCSPVLPKPVCTCQNTNFFFEESEIFVYLEALFST